ncbi:hypothetical protein [Streptomyces sp. Rer75]|uniref:hypothetical protein n=1 Tax=Streptomyces sp. Rer75 TaxID=2750011 RepID=UPI0015D003B4|nr:hypothetical protein [Streptomyces sp. Rer75]QLH19491.1 hypothetical protein HYQ63_01530 [Streptomyces sp. Rer75]
MTIVLNEPGVDGLTGVVDALRVWQDDRTPLQLHPGDLGWAWALGADRLAAAVRTWSVDGRIIAVGGEPTKCRGWGDETSDGLNTESSAVLLGRRESIGWRFGWEPAASGPRFSGRD